MVFIVDGPAFNMQTKTKPAQRPPRYSQRKSSIPLAERTGLSPSEFSLLFGKQKVWGYRQIYLGRVKTVTQFGRMMIPRSEVDRILATAAPYNGKAAQLDSDQLRPPLDQLPKGNKERSERGRRS
jgi:hypothetical protein